MFAEKLKKVAEKLKMVAEKSVIDTEKPKTVAHFNASQ
jgi:hypothetical protein